MSSQQQHEPGQPVVGFNHNLAYKGKNFHVQTEDSGTTYAHIITHIFIGGNILNSTKSSYKDVLPTISEGEVFATVRKLMEDQHKAVIKGLMGGNHDAEIAKRTGSAHYEPGVLAGGERAPGLLVGGDKPKDAKPANATPPSGLAKPAAAAPKPAPPPPPPPKSAPPPPAAIAKPAAAGGALPKAPPLARPVAPAGKAAKAGENKGFGEGLISDKSLDEVILAYLAADIDANKRS